MPTITSYRNGATAGMSGRNPAPVKRGVIKGWTAAAVRRHTKWLYSIDAPQLDGVGIALTLTMRDTPASSEVFHAARRALTARWSRLGAVRFHWVVEWQRRGTPHLHCAVYFPAGTDPQLVAAQMIFGWLAIAEPFHARVQSQHFDEIDGALGWLQYLSKHAARGVRHYQRNGKPAGWEKTGRLWGYGGDWPADEPMRFDLSTPAYHRYRRLVRSWRIANAREALVRGQGRMTDDQVKQARRRITFSRRMLACPDPRLSAVRGVSDWLPEDVSLSLLGMLELEGFEVVQRVD